MEGDGEGRAEEEEEWKEWRNKEWVERENGIGEGERTTKTRFILGMNENKERSQTDVCLSVYLSSVYRHCQSVSCRLPRDNLLSSEDQHLTACDALSTSILGHFTRLVCRLGLYP